MLRRSILGFLLAVLVIACGKDSGTGPGLAFTPGTFRLKARTWKYELSQPSVKMFVVSLPGTENTEYPYELTLRSDGKLTGGGIWSSGYENTTNWNNDSIIEVDTVLASRQLLPEDAVGKWWTESDSLGERLCFDFANQIIVIDGVRYNVWWWEGCHSSSAIPPGRHSLPDSSGFRTDYTYRWIDPDGSSAFEHAEVEWVRWDPALGAALRNDLYLRKEAKFEEGAADAEPGSYGPTSYPIRRNK